MASFRWMSRMTRVIDYSDPGDHRMVVQAAFDALREPQLIGLPSECGYLLATSSTNSTGGRQLLKIASSIGGQPLLCLSHPDQLPDFMEPLPPQALRLARRGWPGPILLEFAQSSWSGPPLDAAVVKYFEESARFACSGHPLFAGLGRVQRDPLLVLEAPPPLRKDLGPGGWSGTGSGVGRPDWPDRQRRICLLPTRPDSSSVYVRRKLENLSSGRLLCGTNCPPDG